jgi:hypothetical protein
MKKQCLILLLFALCCCGCRLLATVDNMPIVADPSQALLYEGDITETTAFQTYETQYRDTQAEVSYLINLVRYSNLGFYRNGQTYSGDEGARWLDYKMSVYGKEVLVAEDFATNVAAYSRKSNDPYYIIYPNGTKCLTSQVFLNELKRLRAKIAKENSAGQ